MKRLKYPKPQMTKTELINIMGIPEAVIERAIQHKEHSQYAEKTTDSKTGKWQFNTEEFEWYRSQGAFR